MSRKTFAITLPVATCCRCCCYCRGAVGGDDLCWEVPKCQFLLFFFLSLFLFQRKRHDGSSSSSSSSWLSCLLAVKLKFDIFVAGFFSPHIVENVTIGTDNQPEALLKISKDQVCTFLLFLDNSFYISYVKFCSNL